MKRKLTILLTSFFICHYAIGQGIEIARITVEAGIYDRENVLVSATLDRLDLDLANSKLVLFEIDDGKEANIESQLDMKDGPKLWWKINEK